jgi:hypothetical protein
MVFVVLQEKTQVANPHALGNNGITIQHPSA